MSLTDNRHENNNLSPSVRFTPKLYKLESDIDERFRRILNDYCVDFEKDLPYWKKIDTWCNRAQGDQNFERNYASAVIARSVNIYRKFYNLFKIPDWPE